jgi:DNA repair exonuclease SbcCD nuclease subunit
MFLEPMKELGITMDIIPGNHCVYYRNTNEINSLKELLHGYDNINVIEEPEIKIFDDVKIMLLPWLNAQNYSTFMDWLSKKDADILYGHLELSGFEMYKGSSSNTGINPEVFSKFSQVWSGHFHHQSKRGNIHYLGSPMEFTWQDYNDPRGFHIFDTETKDLTFVQNPYRMYEKFYYSDETLEEQEKIRNLDTSQFANKILKLYVTKKKSPALFEWFIDKIYKENLIDFTIMEDFSVVERSEIDMSDEEMTTKDLIYNYVDTIETSMDKTKIKNIMNNLYVEALHVNN